MQGALDDLFVACAQSEHADKFEEDYFGEGQLEPYRNGELITDAMVELMQQEAELLTEFTAFDYYSLEFECGALVSVLFDGNTVGAEQHAITIYGTRGILKVGDPNTFNGEVILILPEKQMIIRFSHMMLTPSPAIMK